MLKKERELLESNDLLQLHKRFGGEAVSEEAIQLPRIEAFARTDLWSQAIEAVGRDDTEKAKELYTKVLHSDMSPDGKNWWNVLLAIGMKAPLYELERMHRTAVEMPQNVDARYISMAAGELAGMAARREREVRRKKEMAELQKLSELRHVVDQRQEEKNTAERNLRMHR